MAAGVSTPVSYADSPFQEHTDRSLTLRSGVPSASMFFEHLADEDDAALMRPFFDVVIPKIDEHQNHHYMLCVAHSDARRFFEIHIIYR